MRNLIFLVFLLACLAHAFLRGGTAEKLGASVLVAGSFATVGAYSPAAARFAHIETMAFAVDVAVLLAYVALALFTDRYWPIWTTALQLIGVLAHLARLLDPAMVRHGYAFLLALWGYPMLITIAIGTWSYSRRNNRLAASSLKDFSAP
jgi:hypothetical protein